MKAIMFYFSSLFLYLSLFSPLFFSFLSSSPSHLSFPKLSPSFLSSPYTPNPNGHQSIIESKVLLDPFPLLFQQVLCSFSSTPRGWMKILQCDISKYYNMAFSGYIVSNVLRKTSLLSSCRGNWTIEAKRSTKGEI